METKYMMSCGINRSIAYLNSIINYDTISSNILKLNKNKVLIYPKVIQTPSTHRLRFSMEVTYGNNMNCNKLENIINSKKLSNFCGNKWEFGADSDTLELSPSNNNSMILDWSNTGGEYFFKQLDNLNKFLLKGFKLKPSSAYNAINYEGGGHIHLDMHRVYRSGFLKLFLKNLYTFITNNPELNWLFNNPFDIYNCSILNLCDWKNIINNPCDVNLQKNISVIHREFGMDTIEFRFFMMPRTIDEAKLHLELAICIYNYIWSESKEGNEIPLIYNDINKYTKDFDKAKKNLIMCFKKINYHSKNVKHVFMLKEKFLKERFLYDNYYKVRERLT